ncbi:MAG TPA: CPBP family glutamic-type intramembrane protease [Thermoanaerobaculia bacterium]|nr:CPBP family glutamic-type intramembrane protease [Thermoanaerobaculia bacterium]
MSTPNLYLDGLILAAAAYPSGFSYSLFTLRRPAPGEVSVPFLATLVLPYLAVALAVLALRPGLLSWTGAPAPFFLAAVLLAPFALAVEYGIHAVAARLATGRFPRGITLPGFWRRGPSPAGGLLLVLIVVGEEILYRQLWLGALHGSLGLALPLALLASALAYGLNHLAFGATSVVAKTVTGLLLGGLYLAGGSLWPPIVAHGLQNLALFGLARERGR